MKFRSSLIAAVMAASLSLGGCAMVENNTLIISVAEIPQSTLRCLPAPYKNKKFIKINEKQAAYLLARYKTAHADCESKLSTVRRMYNSWKNKSQAI